MDAPVGGVPGGIRVWVAREPASSVTRCPLLRPPPPPPPVKIAEPAAPKQITVGRGSPSRDAAGEDPAGIPETRADRPHPRHRRVEGDHRHRRKDQGSYGSQRPPDVGGGGPGRGAALDLPPTILNGVPVEVNTRVIVRFGLTS